MFFCQNLKIVFPPKLEITIFSKKKLESNVFHQNQKLCFLAKTKNNVFPLKQKIVISCQNQKTRNFLSKAEHHIFPVKSERSHFLSKPENHIFLVKTKKKTYFHGRTRKFDIFAKIVKKNFVTKAINCVSTGKSQIDLWLKRTNQKNRYMEIHFSFA